MTLKYKQLVIMLSFFISMGMPVIAADEPSRNTPDMSFSDMLHMANEANRIIEDSSEAAQVAIASIRDGIQDGSQAMVVAQDTMAEARTTMAEVRVVMAEANTTMEKAEESAGSIGGFIGSMVDSVTGTIREFTSALQVAQTTSETITSNADGAIRNGQDLVRDAHAFVESESTQALLLSAQETVTQANSAVSHVSEALGRTEESIENGRALLQDAQILNAGIQETVDQVDGVVERVERISDSINNRVGAVPSFNVTKRQALVGGLGLFAGLYIFKKSIDTVWNGFSDSLNAYRDHRQKNNSSSARDALIVGVQVGGVKVAAGLLIMLATGASGYYAVGK